MAAERTPAGDALRKIATDLRAVAHAEETRRFTKAAHVLFAAKGLLTLRKKVNAQ